MISKIQFLPIEKNVQLVIFLNLILAELRQGLKNRQVNALFSASLRGKTRIFDDYTIYKK
ncbi:hypothetical protein MNB_SUP05-SYMBIONT-5-1408 [hydrothermal vent metagenome]|uniref:Uncharacterized protein n=1 Tax=hydrothermal vent metagenome TaxID=652676 RepID=A0A1W1E4B4_9ZZZZ